jgi:hypothetical protein
VADKATKDKAIAEKEAEDRKIGVVNLLASGPQGVLGTAKTGKTKLLGN